MLVVHLPAALLAAFHPDISIQPHPHTHTHIYILYTYMYIIYFRSGRVRWRNHTRGLAVLFTCKTSPHFWELHFVVDGAVETFLVFDSETMGRLFMTAKFPA